MWYYYFIYNKGNLIILTQLVRYGTNEEWVMLFDLHNVEMDSQGGRMRYTNNPSPSPPSSLFAHAPAMLMQEKMFMRQNICIQIFYHDFQFINNKNLSSLSYYMLDYQSKVMVTTYNIRVEIKINLLSLLQPQMNLRSPSICDDHTIFVISFSHLMDWHQ